MSAEPARPTGPDRHPLAPVLLINEARPRRHPRSERTPVPPPPDRPLSDQERLAAKLEAVFARHGRSLTDESTALDFRISLGECRRLLAGALEQGILNEDQHSVLDTMLEAMLAVPALLA